MSESSQLLFHHLHPGSVFQSTQGPPMWLVLLTTVAPDSALEARITDRLPHLPDSCVSSETGVLVLTFS